MEISITVIVSEVLAAQRRIADAKDELAKAIKKLESFNKDIKSGKGIPQISEMSIKLQFETGYTRINTQTLNERATAMIITVLRVYYEQDVRLWESAVSSRVIELNELAEKINGATVVNNYTTDMLC